MSGTLYVVATPIGNLEDITLRALRVLREVAVIAAEDTRRTRKLLHHHAISTPTVSFHEHNTTSRLPELMARLARGESVALVSDAGTPVLSDPGLELIRACVDADVFIDPLPGASAHLTALVASGFPADPVTLLGFAPAKSNARNKWLSAILDIPHTVVFFESPHRILATMRELASILVNRPLVVARELTKVHQELLRGTAHQLVERLKNPRGEFTVVVGPRLEEVSDQPDSIDLSKLFQTFCQLTNVGGVTRRQAIAELAKRHGRSSREIYAALERGKGAFLDPL